MQIKSSLGEESITEVVDTAVDEKDSRIVREVGRRPAIQHGNDVLRVINRLKDEGARDIVLTLTKAEAAAVVKSPATVMEEGDEENAKAKRKRVRVDLPTDVKIAVGA